METKKLALNEAALATRELMEILKGLSEKPMEVGTPAATLAVLERWRKVDTLARGFAVAWDKEAGSRTGSRYASWRSCWDIVDAIHDCIQAFLETDETDTRLQESIGQTLWSRLGHAGALLNQCAAGDLRWQEPSFPAQS